jgi:hypothetical protein
MAFNKDLDVAKGKCSVAGCNSSPFVENAAYNPNADRSKPKEYYPREQWTLAKCKGSRDAPHEPTYYQIEPQTLNILGYAPAPPKFSGFKRQATTIPAPSVPKPIGVDSLAELFGKLDAQTAEITKLKESVEKMETLISTYLVHRTGELVSVAPQSAQNPQP